VRPLNVFVVIAVALVLLYASTSLQGITGMAPISVQADANTAVCTNASDAGLGGGDTLTLTTNVTPTGSNCIQMDVANTTLDCDGFTIDGNDSGTNGVVVMETNVTVQGCIVKDFTGTGISASNSATFSADLVTVRNNTVEGNGTSLLTAGSGVAGLQDIVTVVNNRFIETPGGSGVRLQQASNSVYENNTHNGDGPNIQRSENVTVRNNTFNGTLTMSHFMTPNTNVVVEGNTWLEDLDNASNSALALNGMNNNNLTFRHHDNVSMRVFCTNCHNSTFSNNTHYGNARLFVSGTNVTIEDSVWPTVALGSGVSGGIDYSGSTSYPGGGVVRNNRIMNGRMFSLTVSANNTVVENNTIANVSGQGIVIEGNNITVQNNVITNLTGVAFRTSGNDTDFLGNNVTFILKIANTSLNLNTTTPQIPEGSIGFWLEENSVGANASDNRVFVLNPQGLDVGVIGAHAEGALHAYIGSNTFNNTLYDVLVEDATNVSVIDNMFTNARFKSIAVEGGSQHTLRSNDITGGTIAPSVFLSGIELYRTSDNVVDAETVSSYHMGVHLLNASDNNLTNVTVTSGEFGVYSLFGTANDLFNVSADATVSIGMRFIDSNSSTILNATISSPITGIDFHDSFFNTVNVSSISGAATGMEFNLFSGNNSVNTNTFAGNTLDILFDMFASGNTGAGNGGPSTRSENGASGNVIG